MQTILYVELNTFALFILLIIHQNLDWKSIRSGLKQRFYVYLIYSNICILILDTAMWLLEATDGTFYRNLYIGVTAAYYIMNPVCSMLLALYLREEIVPFGKKHTMMTALLTPAAVNAVLSVLSIFFGMYFTIDENNSYHRGELFFLMVAISYVYFGYGLLSVIVRSRGQKKGLWSGLAIAAFPIAASVVQCLYQGLSVIWVSMALAILIAFIKLQNHQMYTDHLTGLFNRRQLDNYMDRLSDSAEKKMYGGIMIDLNAFKSINDLYGHAAGDRALENAAKILQRTFRKSDFIARYGGDEFTVVMEIKERADLEMGIERLKKNVTAFNTQSTEPFKIDLSLGYDIYESKKSNSAGDFIKHIDKLMYKDKAK